jgi:hypothetical protein
MNITTLVIRSYAVIVNYREMIKGLLASLDAATSNQSDVEVMRLQQAESTTVAQGVNIAERLKTADDRQKAAAKLRTALHDQVAALDHAAAELIRDISNHPETPITVPAEPAAVVTVSAEETTAVANEEGVTMHADETTEETTAVANEEVVSAALNSSGSPDDAKTPPAPAEAPPEAPGDVEIADVPVDEAEKV